jgi:indolepyruvate ferredoxin oxidoreductase beta subunit
MLAAGARKLTDYLDPAYAVEYLDRVGMLCDLDRAAGGEGRGFAFTAAAAKYLANAMAYDDIARVADLKIRTSRRARVRAEVDAKSESLVSTTEYFHPRVDEICGALPSAWGAWIEARPRLVAALRKVVDHGRRIRTDTISGYLVLAAVASLRSRRRGSLRHARERAHIDAWLKTASDALAVNYALGVEVLACRRLVKGYSDTHARGLSKFDRVLAAAPKLAEREDGAVWLDRLKRAALADERGVALDGVLMTVASL